MTITAILKGRVDQYGRQPIQIRISQGKKRKFKPTKLKIEPKFWNADKGLAKPSYGNAADLNAKIRNIIIQIEGAELRGEEQERYPDVDFFQYAKDCLNEWDKVKAHETLRHYRYEAEKIKQFSPVLLLSSITPQWLKKYQAWCYGKGNTGNTVWKSFKYLRLMMRKAQKEKLVKENPFDNFEMPRYKNPSRTFLTAEEVARIEALLTKDHVIPQIKYCAAWFLIGCHTGLRYQDLASFDEKRNLKAGRLIVTTHKTKDVVSMPFDEVLQPLFEFVGYKPLKYSNQVYNRMLKDVAALAEIDVELTSHIARHTFGTLSAAAGISQEVTARYMGHTDLKTTSIYYKIGDQRSDTELQKLRSLKKPQP